jgi:hypothetical protein
MPRTPHRAPAQYLLSAMDVVAFRAFEHVLNACYRRARESLRGA